MGSSTLLMMTGCARCARPDTKVSTRCANTTQRDHKAAQSPPEFRMTAMILYDHVSGKPTFIDLTKIQPDGVPVAPYVPFRTNHSILFSVQQTEVVDGVERVHDYSVLMGPDPTRDLYAEGEMRASAGRYRLGVGWVHFDGDLPVGETELTGTSARGTEMAMQIRPHMDPRLVEHLVYNLETTGNRMVDVWRHNDRPGSFPIPPGKYVVITKTSHWPPSLEDVDWQDPLVRHMRKMARLAMTKGKARKSN